MKTSQLLSYHAAQRSLKLSWSQAYLFKALHCYYYSFPPIPVHFPVFLSYFPLTGSCTLDSIHNLRSCKREYCYTGTETAELLTSLARDEGLTDAPHFQYFISSLMSNIYPMNVWSVKCKLPSYTEIAQEIFQQGDLCKHPFWKEVVFGFACLFSFGQGRITEIPFTNQ